MARLTRKAIWSSAALSAALFAAPPLPARAAPVQESAATTLQPAPPLPPPRPHGETDEPAEAEPGTNAEPVSPPLPPPRPHDAAGRDSGEGKPEAGAPAETALCRHRLETLGVRFEVRPTLREGACGVEEPLLVRGLPDGVEIAPASLMTCPLAEALAKWVAESVRPEAAAHFESRLVRLSIGTAYECRDQRSGAKLSEHAFANGIDLMGFGFEGRPAIPVGFKPDGSVEGTFQAAVRTAACAHFTTVLGPGSDPAHADHLHLDMRARKRGFRICQ